MLASISFISNDDDSEKLLADFLLYHCQSKGLSNCSRRVGNTLTRRIPTGHTGQSYLIAITVDTAWYIWFFLYWCKKRETKMNMTHEVINTISQWCAWNCDAKVCIFNFKLQTECMKGKSYIQYINKIPLEKQAFITWFTCTQKRSVTHTSFK